MTARPSHLKIHQRIHSGSPSSSSAGDCSVQRGSAPGHRLLRCQQCSYMTPYLSLLKRHQQIHTGERPHQCSHCGKTFMRKDILESHLRTHTGERPYQCHLCPNAFARKTTLLDHVRTHTGEKPFRCHFCPMAFTHRIQRKAHEQKEHSHRPALRPLQNSPGVMAVSTRKGNESSPSVVGCSWQHRPQPSRRLLHCKQCRYETLRPSDLKRRQRIHMGERPHLCHLCPSAFSYRASLVRHQRSHTGERPFKCSHCGKAFVRKDQLDVHLRTHTGERPYQCHLCPSTFAQQATLDNHVRTHVRERPFRCRFCPKAFSRRPRQKTHEKKEHKTQPCTWSSTCVSTRASVPTSATCAPAPSPNRPRWTTTCAPHGRAFLLLTLVPAWSSHPFSSRRCTTGGTGGEEGPTVCVRARDRKEASPRMGIRYEQLLCSTPTGRGPFLSPNGHTVQHGPRTSRRLLCCQQCSYATPNSSTLKRHLRIHTGERPYHCHLCPSAFTQMNALHRHVRVHTGERPFRCRFCPEAFARRQRQKAHEKEQHNYQQYWQAKTMRKESAEGMPICVGVQVAVQSGLLDKGLGAQVALVWTLACMDAQVVDQVALPHEGLAAMAALEGTLARVLDQVGLLHEGLVTVAALEGSLARVRAQVVDQVVLPNEGLVTVAALEGALARSIAAGTPVSWKGSKFFPLLPAAGSPSSPSVGSHRQQHGLPPGRRLLQCQQCSFSALHPSHMKRHQRSHTGERPYQCSHCNKAFAMKTHLDVHLRTHTGERPYQCSHCNKAFATKTQLDVHLRTHTGERPYECHLCPSTFTHKSTLDSHVRSHTGERPFRCRLCPKAFTHRRWRKAHETREHKTQPL
ncbi:uncharacterized protein LOC144179848 [Haemaphysalis longicornis]